MPFIDVIKWHAREISVPRWLRISIAVGALFLAQFLAYRDSLSNLNKVVEEKRQTMIDRNNLGLKVARLQANIENRDSIISSQQQLLNSKFSLRQPIKLQVGGPSTGWKLDESQSQELIKTISRFKGTKTTIQYVVSAPGASDFAYQLCDILEKAGWQIGKSPFPSASPSANFVGVHFYVKAADQVPDGTGALRHELETFGIAVVGAIDQSIDQNSLTIYIGAKP